MTVEEFDAELVTLYPTARRISRIYGRGLSPADREDCVQEAFFTLLQRVRQENPDAFLKGCPLEVFVVKAVKYAVLKEVRRARKL